MMKLRMLFLLIVVCPSICLAQGYRIEGNRIVVEGEDWKAWDYPKRVLEFGEQSGLRPRFVRKNINACLDAPEFGGGLGEAGSNPSDVTKVMDGDMSTFWEPGKDTSLEDWWFEMDVGRAVSATKLVLKFVEGDVGDPFLQFKAEVSSGYKGRYAQRSYYNIAGKTTKPNESQRVFDFTLPTASGAEEEFRGDVVRYVRIRVTDSRGDKGEQISKERYEELDPDQRGAVEYYRITEVGEERLVTEEVYEKLPPERQGAVRYYRRELPCLAEVEVWSLGENLSLGILDRGGWIEARGYGSGQVADAFDGDMNTTYTTQGYAAAKDMGWTRIDLGTLFWVDTIRFLTTKPHMAPLWKLIECGFRTAPWDRTIHGYGRPWRPSRETRSSRVRCTSRIRSRRGKCASSNSGTKRRIRLRE